MRILIVVLFVGLWASGAWAQSADDERLAAAKELVIASGSLDVTTQITGPLLDSLRPLIAEKNPEHADLAIDVMKRVFDEKFEENRQNFIDAFGKIYADNFTLEEIQGIRAFYETAAGKALIAKQGIIAQLGLAAGQAFGLSLQQDLLEGLVAAFEEEGLVIPDQIKPRGA